MKTEKAREFFSAYYEGGLNHGIKLALERKLADDATLRADYDAFCLTVKRLGSLKSEVPKPDFDLHERIMARVDRHAWEQKRARSPSLLTLWRSLVLGGLATLALVAALTQLQSGGRAFLGGLGVSPTTPAGKLYLAVDDGKYVLRYRSEGRQRVLIRSEDGRVLQNVPLDNADLRSEISNKLERAVLFRIEIEGRPETSFLAMPGTGFEKSRPGKGTVADLARAAAGYYRVPVIVTMMDSQVPTTWEFSAPDAYQAVAKALDGTPFKVAKLENEVLRIEPK